MKASNLRTDEQAMLVIAARNAAVALAAFWDVLREIEVRSGVSLNKATDCIESLAAEVSLPATGADLLTLTASDVMEQLEAVSNG